MCAATETDTSDEEFGLCVDDSTSFLCYTQKKQINAALTY